MAKFQYNGNDPNQNFYNGEISITFGQGFYETEDEKEIELLSNHDKIVRLDEIPKPPKSKTGQEAKNEKT